jgi:hypothetical protein
MYVDSSIASTFTKKSSTSTSWSYWSIVSNCIAIGSSWFDCNIFGGVLKWGDPRDKSWMGLCSRLFVAHTKVTLDDIGDKLESPPTTLEVVCCKKHNFA